MKSFDEKTKGSHGLTIRLLLMHYHGFYFDVTTTVYICSILIKDNTIMIMEL